MKPYAILAIVVVAACGDSDRERLDRLRAEADIQCWRHVCMHGPGAGHPEPEVPTEDGVACMNDALATGARAAASWGIHEYNLISGTQTQTYLFIVDHEVRRFSMRIRYSDADDDPPDVHVEELPTCAGPVRIGPEFCTYRSPDPDGPDLPVNALAVDGCP